MERSVKLYLKTAMPTAQDNYIRYYDPGRYNRNLVFVPQEWFGDGPPNEMLTLTFHNKEAKPKVAKVT